MAFLRSKKRVSEAGDRRAGELRTALVPILLAHVCLHAAMTGARMAAPLFALGQGMGEAAAGVLVALFAATQIFLSLPAGRFADRHGLKKPVGLGIMVIALGAGLAAIWPTYPVLCLTALLCGGGVGVATITVQRHVGRLAKSPGELRQAFSLVSIAPAASNFLGPFAAGLLIDHAGYRAAFALLAFFPVIAWVLLRRVTDLPLDPVRPRPRSTAWDLLRRPAMRRLLIMSWFMNASWDLHGFMVPLLGHERGLSASAIGSILGVFAVAAALIRLLIPLFAGRLREWALITGATAVAGAAFLLYPFSPSALVMGICSFVIGAALGMVQPMVMSMLHQITPGDRQGEAVALRLMLVNMSSVAMPLLFGSFGGLVGAGGVFWFMGVIVGAGSRLGMGLRNVANEEQQTDVAGGAHPP